MSPDDILAASLWPWPDPLLKRDRAGNILFVNAAFLQLYGGRIEDWTGRALTGWPAPSTQGAQRFETHAGEGATESIYDWVETVMADGNTMAIARNVTAIIATATQNAQAVMPPTQMQTPAAPEAVAPQPIQQAPIQTSVQASIQAPIAEPQPIHVTPSAPQPNLTSDFEDTLDNNADDYSYQTTAEPVTQAPTQNQAAELAPSILAETPPPIAAPEPEEERMIERRALPIEDSENVLGSNWRDQVIAKAIGADVQTETHASVQSPTSSDEEDGPVGSGLHILLAEDNAINALLTRTLLEADGATVETVEDGALAVEAVKNNNYDLVFMDMRMPNMDGLESTRKIRALGKTMPIVALTANAFDDDRNSCFDSGMNDFMTKPVSAEELTEMVRTWVKNAKEDQKIAS